MDSGEGNPGYRTDESVASSTTDDEQKVPKKKVLKELVPKIMVPKKKVLKELVPKGIDSGAHTSVDDVSGPSIRFSGEKDTVGLVTKTASSRTRSSCYRATEAEESNILKQTTSVVVGSGLNSSTLSLLNKMQVVQASFAGQLETLSNKCEEWSCRALKAEAEMKAAEAVIETMMVITDSEMNSEVISSEEKSVDFEADENVAVTDDEGGYGSELSEEDARAGVCLNYANFGLSPDFRGRNFSDNPIYRDGNYTPRGGRFRSFRGRSRNNFLAHGSVVQKTDDRNELGENCLSSLTERSKIQCCKCELYGHFSRECQEKTRGYLALSKPVLTGNAEVKASAEAPTSSRGFRKQKIKNKSVTVTVAVVEEKPTEQLN